MTNEQRNHITALAREEFACRSRFDNVAAANRPANPQEAEALAVTYALAKAAWLEASGRLHRAIGRFEYELTAEESKLTPAPIPCFKSCEPTQTDSLGTVIGALLDTKVPLA